MNEPSLSVAVVLFDDVEVLDFAGPYEVLTAAERDDGTFCATVFTVAERTQVRCHGGLRVVPDVLFAELSEADVLIVPGGPGARSPSNARCRVIDFLRDISPRVQTVAAVCTGSFLLAEAGLLKDLRATTHPARIAEFQREFPDVLTVPGKVVDEGRIVTSGGVSSGIDLALHLLSREFGETVRNREAKRLDGPW